MAERTPWITEESCERYTRRDIFDDMPTMEEYERNEHALRTNSGLRRGEYGGLEKVRTNPPVQGRRWRRFTD